MKFIFIADQESEMHSFFPVWEIILLVITVTTALALFFPHKLLKDILAQQISSEVTLTYLKAFSAEDPDNIVLLSALAEQEIGTNHLVDADITIAKLAKVANSSSEKDQLTLKWLDYLVLRQNTYNAKLNTEARIALLKKLRALANALSTEPFSPKQLQILAQDSIYLGKPEFALAIYNQLMQSRQLTTVADYARGGNIALQNSAYEDSARFYWAASTLATDPEEKKNYALEAVKVLWGGNKTQQALELAQKLPEFAVNDPETLLLLSKLALATNKPKIAEQYALRALFFNNNQNE